MLNKKTTVEIMAPGNLGEELNNKLKDSIDFEMSQHINFQSSNEGTSYHSIDPTILITIVGATSAALGALFTGILSIAKELVTKKITVKFGDTHVEIPANISNSRLNEILGIISKHHSLSIHLDKNSTQ